MDALIHPLSDDLLNEASPRLLAGNAKPLPIRGVLKAVTLVGVHVGNQGRQRVGHYAQALFALPQFPFRQFTIGDLVYHNADAEHGSVFGHEWIMARQPVSFYARLGRSRPTDVDIDFGFARLEDPSVHGLQDRRQRRKDLSDRAADVLRDRLSVDLGQPLVDPEVTEIPVQKTEANGSRLIEMFELQGLVVDGVFLRFGWAHF